MSALKRTLRKPELETRLRHRAARDPILRVVRDEARRLGAEVWLVGGYVRDTAVGRAAEDVDLATGKGTRALLGAVRAAWRTSGFRFRKRGVTTWRFRVGARDVDLVDASRRGLPQDLRRRELTLNAIAFDLTAGRVVDPVGGLADLRARRLRVPRAGVMRDDPVRALRAARFVAQFPEMRLHASVRHEAHAAGRGLASASPERVRDELDALLLGAAPHLGLTTLERLGLLHAVLPELESMRSCTAGADRPDVWRHTLDAVERSARVRGLPGTTSLRDPDSRLVLRWTLLLHDIAKPDTLEIDPRGRPTFHGHEAQGAVKAEALLRRLRQPRELRRRVRRLVLYHLRPHHLADAGAPLRGMRRLVRESGDDLGLLLVHAACDARASGAPDARRRFRRLRAVLGRLDELAATTALRPVPALLDGRDIMAVLGVPPGPEVGRWLDRLAEQQDDGYLRTRAQAVEWLRRQGRRRHAP